MPLRVCAFVDGYNLFKAAQRCFGYKLPNYDIRRLVDAVVNMVPSRQLATAHYYIGIPTRLDDPANNLWWTKKLAAMGRTGVKVETRPLKKRALRIRLDGIANFDQTVSYLKEKGIDLKMGLDMVRLARSGSCDTVIVFSQDGDLVEAVAEVHAIAAEQHRGVTVECAFPAGVSGVSRPIKMAIPRPISKAIYDSCIDPTDYRL
jgi:hypothetical protein